MGRYNYAFQNYDSTRHVRASMREKKISHKHAREIATAIKGLNIEKTVNRSKAVGEPPLMLALSTFMALKNAVNNNNLKAPATPENILMALQE